jgi:hypothetical protein
MEKARGSLRTSLLATVLVFGLLGSPVMQGAPRVWLMTFTFDSAPGGAEPYRVEGDGADPIYKDYRLGSGQPDDTNYCVETLVTPALFIRLNRRLDDAGTQYCGPYGGTPRQFSVRIANAAACEELWSHGYPSGPDAPCTFTGADKPRIRIDADLYAKRTSRTRVAFLSKWYDVSATSYELRTEAEATVLTTSVDSSIRIVSYSGNARLWRFEAGVQESAVAEAFPLPFQMTFKRTAQ